MSEIQRYEFGAPPVDRLAAPVEMSRGDRSREWLALFFETAKASEILASTDFVPTAMRGKPAQVAAAIMRGYELDIDPLDALGNIFSVHGRIGFYAEFMRRRIIQAGHEIRPVETSDTRAVVEGRRKGTDEWQRASFTAAQARTAKIDISAYPEDKLFARATSRLCRRVFPDVLSGAAIVEDLDDEQRPTRATSERLDSTSGTAPRATSIQRKRQPRSASVPTQPSTEPDLDDEAGLPEPVAAATPEAGEPACTRTQQTRLNALLERQEGIGRDRTAKLAYLREQFGRDFTSATELTSSEASELIDVLDPPEPEAVSEVEASAPTADNQS